MKAAVLIGIALVVLSILAFSYQSISYTKREKVLDLGPFQATTEKRESILIPPVLASAALIGGIALILVGNKH